MRALQTGLWILGATGFAWLIASTGLDTLWRQALELGGLGTLAIVALGGVDQLFHALGWRQCFPPRGVPRFGPLLTAHLAGNAINLATPTATAGGELVRATLLPADIERRDAVAALTVDRLTFAASDALIGLCGVAVLLLAPGLGPAERVLLAGGTSLVIAGIAVFSALQRSGRLITRLTERPWLARWTRRWMGDERAQQLREAGNAVDGRIARLHAERPGALLASMGLHALGNAALLGQLACLVAFTGTHASWPALLQVFVVVSALDLASFFVPARLGAQEGARMLGVALAGLPVELGLVFSLAQRVEQAVWTGAGFALYSGALARGRRHAIDAS